MMSPEDAGTSQPVLELPNRLSAPMKDAPSAGGNPKSTQSLEMNLFKDPILLVLSGLLGISLLAFLSGVFPYPLGLVVLVACIAARLLSRN